MSGFTPAGGGLEPPTPPTPWAVWVLLVASAAIFAVIIADYFNL